MSSAVATPTADIRQRAQAVLRHYARQIMAAGETSAFSPVKRTDMVLALLEKCQALAETPTFIHLLHHFGPQLQRESHLGYVDALFAAALEVGDLSDEQRVALADLRVRILIQLGERETAHQVLEQARPAASTPQLRSRLYNRLGHLLASYGDFTAARVAHEQGVAEARLAGDAGIESTILSNLGDAQAQQRDYHAAIATFEQALALARQVQAPYACAYAEGGLAGALDHLGRHEEAMQRHLAARRHYQEAGDDFGVLRVTINQCYNAYLQGEFRQVASLAEEALQQARALGDLHRLAFAHHRLGQAHLGLGDYALAYEHFQAALDLRLELGKPVFVEATVAMLQQLQEAIAGADALPAATKARLLAQCQAAVEAAAAALPPG